MRFQRQIGIFGEEGQSRIENAVVGVVGLGGLGCNVITQLASAGIGKFIIADSGFPEESNLNRQFIYAHHGMDDSKTTTARRWIESISPAKVDTVDGFIDDGNISRMECDVLVDCCDSDRTRLMLNRFVHEANIPLIHGATESTYGQVATVIPRYTMCMECILTPGDDNAVKDSMSPAVSLIASVQSSEVLKTITGVGETLSGKLFSMDLRNNTFRVIDVKKRPGCPVCGSV